MRQVFTKDNAQPSTPVTALQPGIAANRFTLNFASNMGYMALSTILTLWYVPYLIEHLGVAVYGMVPLANSLVMFTAIVSSSLDVSINRFLAIDLNRGDVASANRTFNTALALSTIACVALLVVASALIWLFPALFHVPAGLENQTRLLFAAVMLTSLTAILGANFAVASLVLHRFDLRNLVRTASVLTRAGVVVMCFLLMPAQLWHVSLGFAVAALVGLLGDVVVWRRLTPQLHVRPGDVQRERMRQLLGLSGWSVINQVGILLLMQADLIIINNLFGPEMTGTYGSLLLFPQLIHTLTETVISILSPAIMGLYARGESEGLRAYTVRSVRLLGLALALPIGLLCGFGGVLLEVWLGPEFRQYQLLLIILVGHLGVNLATRPLGYVLTAYNRVRIQGLVTLGLGVVNVGLALALGWWWGLGPLGVAMALAIVWTARSFVFLAGYTARTMQMGPLTFVRPLVAGVIGTAGVAIAGWALTIIWWPQGWIGLGLAAAPVSVAYLAAVYALALAPDERALLLKQLPWRRSA